MKSVLKFEWNRLMHSKSLLLAAGSAALLVLADVIYQFILYLQDVDVYTSVFYKWLGVNNGLFVGNLFFLTLPLLTAIAYSWTVSFDRSSGYIQQIITRSGRGSYFTAKYLVSFLSGGIIFAGALLLDFLLLATFSPAYQPIPGDLASFMDPMHFCSELFYQNTYLFMLLWLITAFFWGGAMASIGTAAGMFLRKHILVGIFPFLIFTAQQIIGSFLMQKYQFTQRGTLLGLVWTDMLYAGAGSTTTAGFISLNIGAILLVSLLAYLLRSRNYESV